MSFEERVKSIAARVEQLRESLNTEEATKNALIMPFIQALGYDVFNPLEVVPEFTADVGTKKHEKVDYAIKRGDEVVMLVEAKKAGAELTLENSSQLYRYFSVVNARLALLTNGVEYRFYSDIDEPNRMDAAPFLVLNLLDLREDALKRLRRLTKEHYDLDHMLNAAEDLKYTSAIRQVIEVQLEDPDEEFVRYFFQRAAPGRKFVASAREQFTPLVKQAFTQMFADHVSKRLRSALEREDLVTGRVVADDEETVEVEGDEAAEPSKEGIITTEEELEGFRIVRAICRQVIDVERITHRDTKSYFGILVDDNNRKPVCRLHLNRSQWYLGLFDDDKNETRHAIASLDSLYDHAAEIVAGAARWAE
jgi:hypothetical protein